MADTKNASAFSNIGNTSSLNKISYIVRTDLITTYAVVASLGFILNVAAIVIIVRGKMFGKGLKPQLLNLAVADLLSSIFAGTFIFLALPYPDSSLLCKIHQFVYFVTFYASLLGNAEIGVEKVLAVYFPLRMRYYRGKATIAVIAVVWVVAGLTQIDLLVHATVRHDLYREDVSVCRSKGLSVPFTVAKFAFPIIIIIIAYIFIGVKLCRRKPVGEQLSQTKRNSSNSIRVVVMLAVDALAAALTWSVYIIWLTFASLPSTSKMWWTGIIPAVSSSIPLTNCFITPLIYFSFNRDFRGDGKELVQSLYKRMRSKQ